LKSGFTRELLDETPDAIIVRAPGGKVLHWNHAAEIMFGFARAEALGKLLTISLFRRPRWMKKADFKKRHAMREYSL
jgi:PAS domain S-box-containing protein